MKMDSSWNDNQAIKCHSHPPNITYISLCYDEIISVVLLNENEMSPIFIKYYLEVYADYSISTIYTTKIDGVVCPPNISETVAGRLMKLAHRQRIASTTITHLKKNLLSILSILVKTILRIVAHPGSGKTIQPIRI